MDDLNGVLLEELIYKSGAPANFLASLAGRQLERIAHGLEGQSETSDHALRQKLKESVGSEHDQKIFDTGDWGIIGSTIAGHDSSDILLAAFLYKIPHSREIAVITRSYPIGAQAVIIKNLAEKIINKAENAAYPFAQLIQVPAIRSFILTYCGNAPEFVHTALKAAPNTQKTIEVMNALGAIPLDKLSKTYLAGEPLAELIERAYATQCPNITSRIARALLHPSTVKIVYASAEIGPKQAEHTIAAIADIAQYADRYNGEVSHLLRRLEKYAKHKPDLIMLASEIVYWTGDANLARTTMGWLHRQTSEFFSSYIRELLKRPDVIQRIKRIPKEYDLTSPHNYAKKNRYSH